METYLSRTMSISFASLIFSSCQSVLKWLIDSYNTFDFMNYAFAKMVIAWL